MINMGELFAHPKLRSVPMERIQLTDGEKSRFDIKAGDLIFARRSLVAAGAGKCAIVCEVLESTTFESSIIRARPDPEIADSYFLFYLFNSPLGRHLLDTILRQVAVSGITGSDLVKLKIPLPPLPTQHAIARILGTLDDKIELNRRMNETLEAMARAIFKSWFVDFDPVRAKAEGRQPAGMDTETAALFPSEFEEVDGRKVPKGWRVRPIGDIVQIVGGSTPSTKNPDYWEGNINFATPKDLAGLTSPVLLRTERTITEEGMSTISSGLLPKKTVLLSSRAPIGYLALTMIPVAINQGFIAIPPSNGLNSPYLLNWINLNMDEILSRAGGTTFQEISKTNFRSIMVITPTQDIMNQFEAVSWSLYERIIANERESSILTQIRDTLLPRLISGEIEIKV